MNEPHKNAREKILAEFSISNGRIKNPGKFEGEPIYVPYFWEQYLNGFWDFENSKAVGFHLTKEEKNLFPEIPKRKQVIKIKQTDQGFVCEV